MDVDTDAEVAMPPLKALKTTALPTATGKSRRLANELGVVNRYSSVAAPYGPTDPVASTYFQVVISKAKAPIVCGDAGPVKGKAIYANKDLPKATRIWTESPLVAMQHETNRSLLPSCQFCYLPLLGSAQTQWQEIVDRYNHSRNQTQSEDQTATPTTVTPVDLNALEKALQVLQITPRLCGMDGPGAKCVCGELYCSKLCQMMAFHEYHAVLCPRNDPCSAMGEFLEHTRHTNDIFLLAAKVIARVLSRYLVWRDIVKAREPIDMFYKKPWWEVVVVDPSELESLSQESDDSEATLGHTTASSSDETNSETGGSSSDGESKQKEREDASEQQRTEEMQQGGPPATYSIKAQCLQEVLTLTHQLLVDALECNLVRLEREGQLRGVSVEEIWRCCSSVLSFEFFTALIGLFEMNNISMEVDHPFHAFIDILDPDVQNDLAAGDLDHSDGQDTAHSPRFQPHLTAKDQELLATVRNVLVWEEERLTASQAEERLRGKETNVESDPSMPLGYPSIEGTALFPIICTMNHSCDPNCTVLYTKNGAGHVVAIRDIQKGEELCICYIDIDMDVEAREANLREYKFKCFCTRCVEERQQREQQQETQQRKKKARMTRAGAR